MADVSHAAGYRPDIDGLRALAVLPVVFGHAGFSGFSGGFVGVDIFFVISGFLITGIMIREIEAGQLSIVRFYERRARRILPALFALVAACMVGGLFILAPGAYEAMALSVVATLFFVSNIWFWMETSTYFGTDAHLLPMLHTWSLAVEEQFYLLFPLLLWALAARSRQVIMAAVGLLSVTSFGLSVWATTAEPTLNFFLTPTRVWELGLGALLALGAFPGTRSRIVVETVAAGGVALIVASIVLLSDETPFPGLAALPTCLGTVAILWAGAQRSNAVGRILSSPLPVFFGLISYSLYLWHWPLLVGARIAGGSTEIGLAPATGAIIAAIVLAWLSWRFVERPFRKPVVAGGLSGRSIFALSGAGAAALVGFAGVAIVTGGFERRLPTEVMAMYRTAVQRSQIDDACRAGSPDKGLCVIGGTPDGTAKPEVLIWGDSHAGALLPGFEIWLQDAGWVGVAAIKSACPPLLGTVRKDERAGNGCDVFNDRVIAYLQDHPEIRTVILAARWAHSAGGTGVDGTGRSPGVIGLSAKARAEVQDSESVDPFQYGLSRTVGRLHAMNRAVVIFESIPEMGFSVPEALLNSRMISSPVGTRTRQQFDLRNARVDAAFDQLEMSYPITRVSLADIMCETNCPVDVDGYPVYRDEHHLTAVAARRLVPLALGTFDWK